MDMTDPTTLTAVGVVASAGAAAIGKLWTTIIDQHADVKKSLQHCEDEHEKARSKIEQLSDCMATLKSEVGHLKGRMEGFQEAENKRESQSKGKVE